MMRTTLVLIAFVAAVAAPGLAQPGADLLSEDLAARLVGTYDFERGTPYGNQLRVVMVDGSLRVRLGTDERTLEPNLQGRMPLDRQSKFRLIEFAIAGRPQESLQFEIVDQQVSRMNYLNRTVVPARMHTGRPIGVFRTGPDPARISPEPTTPPRAEVTRPEVARPVPVPNAKPAYALPREISLLLIGSYGLSGATPAGARELHVSIVDGTPRIRLGDVERQLVAEGVVADDHQFTVAGMPGLRVSFRLAAGQVQSLEYIDASTTPPVRLTGMPK